jgi:hypothetical protein
MVASVAEQGALGIYCCSLIRLFCWAPRIFWWRLFSAPAWRTVRPLHDQFVACQYKVWLHIGGMHLNPSGLPGTRCWAMMQSCLRESAWAQKRAVHAFALSSRGPSM